MNTSNNDNNRYIVTYGARWMLEYGTVFHGKESSMCATWALVNVNMDYLKTTDGTTCPNGEKLTVGGNHSCK